jgi:hypothetical protein
VLVEKQSPVDELPPLPVASDAKTTALWITEVLAHRQPVPEPIAEQVRQCLNVARQLKKQNHE